MSWSRDKGTWAETAVAEYAQHNGFPFADRLTKKGNKDRGDVGWCPGVISEVKYDKSMDIPGWLRETETEQVNAGAKVAFLVVKPPGIGRTRVGWWWSVMRAGPLDELAAMAGYGPGKAVVIGGSSYKKELPPLLKKPDTELVVISPRGVENVRDWYVVTRLERQVTLLHKAGFGSPEVLS